MQHQKSKVSDTNIGNVKFRLFTQHREDTAVTKALLPFILIKVQKPLGLKINQIGTGFRGLAQQEGVAPGL